MNGLTQVQALVSALVVSTGGSVRPDVSENVLAEGAGFALGTDAFGEHKGEPAPASPPPPPPGQASATFSPPPSAARSGPRPGSGV